MNDDVEYIGVFQIKLKKKFYGLDKIDDFAHNGKPKETKTLIVLTHLARRFFVPKTFFTENYKDKVVVYGTLKPQYKNLQGGSIFSAAKEFVQKGISKVKEFFSPRLDNFNNVSTRVLKQYGDVPVVDILIYRTPIPSMLNTLLNAVSFGKWNELKSKYGFDKLFHLALVFRLANGKMVIVEKNEVVNINDAYRTKPNTEVFQVTGYSGGKTLYDFINGARQKVGNDKLFFGYDAFSNNCQFFIRYILETAGLYSEAAKNFLFQDLSKIAENLPSSTKAIAKGVTTLGAVVSKLSGKGKKGKKVGGADREEPEETFTTPSLFRPITIARVSSLNDGLRRLENYTRDPQLAFNTARAITKLIPFVIYGKPLPDTVPFAKFISEWEDIVRANPQTETTPREREESMFEAGDLEADKDFFISKLEELKLLALDLKQTYPTYTKIADKTIKASDLYITQIRKTKTKSKLQLVYGFYDDFIKNHTDIIKDSKDRAGLEEAQAQFKAYEEHQEAIKKKDQEKKGSGKGKKVGGSEPILRENMILNLQYLENRFETLEREFPLASPFSQLMKPKIQEMYELTNRKIITNKILARYTEIYDEVERRLNDTFRRNRELRGSGKPKKAKKGKKVGGADSGSDDELSEIFTKLKVAPPMDVDTAPRPVAPAPPKEPIVRKRAKTPEDKDAKKEKKGSGKPKVGGMEREQRFTPEQYQHTKRVITAELNSQIKTLEKIITNITDRALEETKAIAKRLNDKSVVLRSEARQRLIDDIQRINSVRDSSIDRLRTQIADLGHQLRVRLNDSAYIAQRTVERLGNSTVSRNYKGPFGGPGMWPTN